MKRVRKLARNRLVLSLLIACFMLVSCKKDILRSGPNEMASFTKSNQQFTGQQLYEGVFLKRGGIANQLPTLQAQTTLETLDISPAEQIEIDAAGDLIVAKIIELNSNYFNNLEIAVYSNDHIEIKAMIELGASLTLEAIQEIDAFSFAQELITNSELQEEVINRIGEDGFEDLLNNPSRARVAEIRTQLGDLSDLDVSFGNEQCIVMGIVFVVGVVVLAAAAVGVVAVAAGGIVAVTDVAVTTAAESESGGGGTEEGGTEAGGGIAAPNGTLQFEQLIQDLVDLN